MTGSGGGAASTPSLIRHALPAPHVQLTLSSESKPPRPCTCPRYEVSKTALIKQQRLESRDLDRSLQFGTISKAIRRDEPAVRVL